MTTTRTSRDLIRDYPDCDVTHMTQLGLEILVLPNGEVYDVAPEQPVRIDTDSLDDLENDIVNWMDDTAIESAEDFTGEAKSDWDWIVRTVRNVH